MMHVLWTPGFSLSIKVFIILGEKAEREHHRGAIAERVSPCCELCRLYLHCRLTTCQMYHWLVAPWIRTIRCTATPNIHTSLTLFNSIRKVI